MIELNKVIIIGRLTRKPEIRYLPSGTAVADFDIAYNRRYRSKQDNDFKEEAHFFTVKTFGRSAEFANEWLDKGKAVFVEGRLSQEKWQTRDGDNRSKVVIQADRVQFAESRSSERSGGDESLAFPSAGESEESNAVHEDQEDVNNDLPF